MLKPAVSRPNKSGLKVKRTLRPEIMTLVKQGCSIHSAFIRLTNHTYGSAYLRLQLKCQSTTIRLTVSIWGTTETPFFLLVSQTRRKHDENRKQHGKTNFAGKEI